MNGCDAGQRVLHGAGAVAGSTTIAAAPSGQARCSRQVSSIETRP
jgi:hypothetical protein